MEKVSRWPNIILLGRSIDWSILPKNQSHHNEEQLLGVVAFHVPHPPILSVSGRKITSLDTNIFLDLLLLISKKAFTSHINDLLCICLISIPFQMLVVGCINLSWEEFRDQSTIDEIVHWVTKLACIHMKPSGKVANKQNNIYTNCCGNSTSRFKLITINNRHIHTQRTPAVM